MDPDICDRLEHVIELRHSTRAPFDPAWRITDHQLAHLLDAARWAPTAHNMQNFRIVVVDDARLLAALGATIAGAPLVIMVLYDPTHQAPVCDGDQMMSLGCVMENMWLAAQAEHLDVQVISAFAREGVEADVKRLLGVPSPWRVAFGMRLGHALAASPPQRVRRPVDGFVGRNRF